MKSTTFRRAGGQEGKVCKTTKQTEEGVRATGRRSLAQVPEPGLLKLEVYADHLGIL